MFRIDKESKRIEMNRGDRGAIKLKSDSSFCSGDKIKFTILEKKNYKNILFQKIFTVDEDTQEFVITLTSEDTRIGDVISKSLICWYEIEYNEEQTIIGYDSQGAKEIVIYPEAPNKEE